MTEANRTQQHRPEHGDDDLDILSIVAVVLSGAAILIVLVLAVQVFVNTTVETEHRSKSVEPRYHRLSDHMIEQRLLLEEYGINPDGKTGRVPIEKAMKMVVKRYGASELEDR